jgi:hypothetical protein
MNSVLQDFRYGLRQLRNSPGFTFTAVFTLAIGIGATTAMFSVVLDVLLRPLRYASPEQLVVIRENIATPNREFTDLAVNANHFIFWQQQNRSFTSIAALRPFSMPVGGAQADEIGVAKATSNLISTLGFRPFVGHTFTEEEEKPGHNVVLLTDGFWKRRYGADPAIVGKTVPLDGLQYLVVGILPPEFNLPDSPADFPERTSRLKPSFRLDGPPRNFRRSKAIIITLRSPDCEMASASRRQVQSSIHYNNKSVSTRLTKST